MSTMSQWEIERVAESCVPAFVHDLQAAGLTDEQSRQFAMATEQFITTVVAQVLDKCEHLPAKEYRVG